MGAHKNRPEARYDQRNDPRRIVECAECRIQVLATEGRYLDWNDLKLLWSEHAHQPGKWTNRAGQFNKSDPESL